ncbi:MAG: DUF3604 domain-containing protein [Anaerolineae bacterium]
MLTQEDLRTWYGWAELTPDEPVVAGTLGRWHVIYHAGRYGVAAGGALRLLFPTFGDWPVLQGRDPYEENFITVTTNGRAQLTWRYELRGNPQPWARAAVVEVAQAALVEGDYVDWFLGDPEGGSPGVRAPTACGAACELRVAVDAFGTGNFVTVASPCLRLVGGEPARLTIVVPAQAAPQASVPVTVRVEDRWGNPTAGYCGSVRLTGLAQPCSASFTHEHAGRQRLHVTSPSQSGIWRLQAGDEVGGLSAESNPVFIGQRPALVPLWGDLGVSAPDTPEAMEACLRYGREVAALDFCALTPDSAELTPASWQAVQSAAAQCAEPGRFVALVGYQWSGNSGGGGSRRVLFAGEGGPLYRCRGDDSVCYPLPALYQALRGQRALLIVAAGTPAADLTHYDEDLEALLEVCTARGQVPWLLQEAVRRGRVLGLVGASGDPLGRPGLDCPGAGELVDRSGLTCVWARDHSREALWEGLQARRCYATSGARILLEFNADGQPMGASYRSAQAPRFHLRVAGTAEIERIEIYRGDTVAFRYPEQDSGQPGWLRVVWGGALARDWPRQAPWDGTLRLQGGRLLQALEYGFHSPAQGIVLRQEQNVSWRSTTAGNENGLLLQVDADPEARLEFHAPLGSLKVGMSEIPAFRDLGGEGLYVRIEPRPVGTGQRDLELTWQEDVLPSAPALYWMRVLQVDGECAWSSPIHVRPWP